MCFHMEEIQYDIDTICSAVFRCNAVRNTAAVVELVYLCITYFFHVMVCAYSRLPDEKKIVYYLTFF